MSFVLSIYYFIYAFAQWGYFGTIVTYRKKEKIKEKNINESRKYQYIKYHILNVKSEKVRMSRI